MSSLCQHKCKWPIGSLCSARPQPDVGRLNLIYMSCWHFWWTLYHLLLFYCSALTHSMSKSILTFAFLYVGIFTVRRCYNVRLSDSYRLWLRCSELNYTMEHCIQWSMTTLKAPILLKPTLAPLKQVACLSCTAMVPLPVPHMQLE